MNENRVTLLFDGENCFPPMLSAIRAANTEVLLEMYWFDSDAIGRRFADALAERAQAGVVVRVIYDAVGSVQADPQMFNALRDAGCEVLEYNPIAPWRRRFHVTRVNRRDHRKLLVVDGWIGFTGGINIGNPWMPRSEGGQGWRDDVVQIEGPAALELREVFCRNWQKETHTPIATPVEFFQPTASGTRIEILTDRDADQRRAIRRAYLHRIKTAERRVYISNSYFVPDRAIRVAMARAARRGVDVRVLLPGESDVAAVYYASRRLYSWLLRRRIRVYEWFGSVLHNKSASVDGRWCTVGSYNLDHRSWRFNLEVAAAIHDPGVAQTFEARFLEDLTHASEVRAEIWERRTWLDRWLERFFYQFRKWL